MSGTDIAIRLTDVEKKFPAVTALAGVSMDIPGGTVFGVLGPNGAGKTTLFSVIAGFLRPTTGTVTVFSTARNKIGILPQDAAFQANIPIIEQLTYFLRLSGYSKKDAYRELERVMALVGLSSVYYREAATLSHGMYKRLSLAQAFLGNPEILILDEPTAGLDVVTAEDIRNTIRRLKGGATVLVSSHNMEEMQQLCDHVAVLNQGKLVSVGPVDGFGGLGRGIRFVLSRGLSEEEKAACAERAGDGVFEGAEGEYRVVFPPYMSAEESDRAVGEIQKRILSNGIIIRSLEEDNRIENLYRQVTSGGDGSGRP